MPISVTSAPTTAAHRTPAKTIHSSPGLLSPTLILPALFRKPSRFFCGGFRQYTKFFSGDLASASFDRARRPSPNTGNAPQRERNLRRINNPNQRTGLRRRSSLGLGHADINIVALLAHRIGAQILGGWSRQALARGDVELCRMQRALDRAGLDEALRQDGEFVGAHVVDGVNCTVDPVERDGGAVDVDRKPLAVAQVGGGRNAVPGGHGHDPIPPPRAAPRWLLPDAAGRGYGEPGSRPYRH